MRLTTPSLIHRSRNDRRWACVIESKHFEISASITFRFHMGPLRVFACHGSPRQVNGFLWETTTPSHFLAKLAADADCA